MFCAIFLRLMFIQVKDTTAHVVHDLSVPKSVAHLVGKLQFKRKKYQMSTAKIVVASGHP